VIKLIILWTTGNTGVQ